MRGSPADAVPGGGPAEVFVIRRTTAQRVVGMIGWLLAATPLLLVAPILRPADRMILVMVVVAAGVLLAVFDLVARRDLRLEIHADSLLTGGRHIPWWAIDALDERRFLGVRTVELTAFDLRLRLAVPRTGPVVANPGFAGDVALLAAALGQSRSGAPPDLVPRESGPSVAPVVDLRSPSGDRQVGVADSNGRERVGPHGRPSP